MNWHWKKFEDLTVDELYRAIQLRERVFVVEQKIVYLDCDDKDRKAWHLLGFKDGQLLAYLRAFPPGIKYKEAAFGRVVTAPEGRGLGLGKELTKRAVAHLKATYSGTPIRISAQAYLEKFYGGFGFKRVGENYVEEDIPHLEMLLE